MRVILHIGQHKTGSKALQAALFSNRDFLEKQGYYYPIRRRFRRLKAYEWNHDGLVQTIRSLLARQGFVADSPGNEREWARGVKVITAWLRRLPGEWNEADSDQTVILSAEDLWDMHTAHEAVFRPEIHAVGVRLLADALRGLAREVTVVCYLRRQDHLLGAHYAQLIKGSGIHDWKFARFQESFSQRLDFNTLLTPWENEFGIDQVIVIPYERSNMPEGIVGDFFQRVLGSGPPPLLSPQRDDHEAQNITPAHDYLELMRLLNRQAARGRCTLDRDSVLRAAARDPSSKPIGIAAWLSPADRAALLLKYDQGNRWIARRHGLGDQLFQEPSPEASEPWQVPEPISPQRFLELERQVWLEMSQRSWWRRALDALRWRWQGGVGDQSGAVVAESAMD